MSEPNIDPAPDPDVDPSTDPAQPPEGDRDDLFDPDRAQAKIRKANAEARALRERLKAAEEKAAKYDEWQETQKSEQQRAAEAREAAEKRARDAEQQLLRLEVAIAKGLTPAQARRLQGETREELESDADALLEEFGAMTGPLPGDTVPRRPREALRPGGRGEPDPPEETDPRKLASRVPRR